MIVQACLNGARPAEYHQAAPISGEAVARDGAECVTAGAAELYVHPRDRRGNENLSAVGETVQALRRPCPGTVIGVLTGVWTRDDQGETRARIKAWRVMPDLASVNPAEPDAPTIIALLREKGVAVEGGLTNPEDADRRATFGAGTGLLRVLIEIEEQDIPSAEDLADVTAGHLARHDICKPILLQGVAATVWPLAGLARHRRWSMRVGFEDGCRRADTSVAETNARLVEDAARICRGDGI